MKYPIARYLLKQDLARIWYELPKLLMRTKQECTTENGLGSMIRRLFQCR